MAMTPEARVKKAVKAMLDEMGIWHFSPSMNGFGRAGIPDIVACCNGRFIGIECKAGENVLTALQERELGAIHNHGGFTYIVREKNLLDLRAKLQWIKNQCATPSTSQSKKL